MGGSDPVPSAPKSGQSYEKEIQTYLKYLPQLLSGEDALRGSTPMPGETEDEARVRSQQDLQDKFGPTQYAQQLAALKQLDPTGTAVYDKLGSAVSGDLDSGYALPKDFNDQLTTQIRAAQAARGNVLGDAPVTAESAYKGKAAIDLYQQHLDNAGQFLGLAGPDDKLGVTPVAPDRTSSYVNPNAGFLGQQFALSNYGNELANYKANTAQGNPWARALSGAASGAAAGGGGWGSLALGVAGGVGGYLGG